ncbi:MAG TPA: hypothetical protein VD970_09635 [Acetobacteraceae bacterium]|nr:hypothetical protein [Acetobacteraceae bacterium]
MSGIAKAEAAAVLSRSLLGPTLIEMACPDCCDPDSILVSVHHDPGAAEYGIPAGWVATLVTPVCGCVLPAAAITRLMQEAEERARQAPCLTNIFSEQLATVRRELEGCG